MNKIIKVILGIFVAFGLYGCVGVSSGGQGYDITVPMNAINSTVGQNFPQKQQTDYGTLMIDKPNILGKQGNNKLGVSTSFSFSNMLIPNGIKGGVSLSSGVRYDTSDRGLYLASPMIEDITFQNFTLSKYMTQEIRNLIGDIIAQQLSERPIYRMNNMGAFFVKGMRIDNGNIVVHVGL